MAFSLTINCSEGDNEFTFTVAGATGGGTVVGTRMDGSQFGSSWAVLRTFAGNETSPEITLAAGVWVITAINAGVLAQVYLYHVVDLTDPLGIQARTLVANQIRASGIKPICDRVYESVAPIDYLKTYPACYVMLNEVVELDTGEGTNARTHWVYPVKVMLAMRKDVRLQDAHARVLARWRQTLLEGFDYQYPGNDTSLEYTRVQPGPMFQQYVFQPGDHLVTCSVFTVNCHVRRARGFPTG